MLHQQLTPAEKSITAYQTCTSGGCQRKPIYSHRFKPALFQTVPDTAVTEQNYARMPKLKADAEAIKPNSQQMPNSAKTQQPVIKPVAPDASSKPTQQQLTKSTRNYLAKISSRFAPGVDTPANQQRRQSRKPI
jgi:hypothetical protein